MPPPSRLRIVNGATNYTFELADLDQFPILVVKKPDSGEIQKTVALQRRADQLDSPWSVTNFSGLGVSKADSSMADADNRFFEGKNIQMPVPGVWCLGPKAQTTTNITGTRQVRGFAEGIGKLFYWADVVGSTSTESVAYWVGSTTTWTDATLVADFNAVVANSGFNCVGMVEHYNTTTTAVNMYALRSTQVTSGVANYQLARSTDGTTWTIIDHAGVGNTPSGAANDVAFGLMDIGNTLYCFVRTTNGQILLRQSTDQGINWTTTTGMTNLYSNNAIRNALPYLDYAAVLRPFVVLREGIWYADITNNTFAKGIGFAGGIEATNGSFATVWRVQGRKPYLVCNVRDELFGLSWNIDNEITQDPLDMLYLSQGLPNFRRGPFTAGSVAPDVMFAAIGGNTAARTGGIYRRNNAYSPLGWDGPIYSAAAANRQVRAMHLSTNDDSTERLHAAVDNGTANDVDLLFFANVTKDPRQVTSYAHAASGTLMEAKNDRGLPELTKRWRYVEAGGSNFSSTNKIVDVFVFADQALADSNSTTGTTLGAITANAGTQNFAATPSGTGLNARAVQMRWDLAGTGDASCYVEYRNIYVKTNLPTKYILRFPIAARPQGSIRAAQAILADVKTLVQSATDSTVVFGEETTAITMEPYRFGEGPITYGLKPRRGGTVNEQTELEIIYLTLVEV